MPAKQLASSSCEGVSHRHCTHEEAQYNGLDQVYNDYLTHLPRDMFQRKDQPEAAFGERS
jgi:hypothetical protein